MLQYDMTDDEVKAVKMIARQIDKTLNGIKIKLTEGLEHGALLMRGRQIAMKAARTNAPMGKAYAEAFRDWKQAFKLPTGKEAESYYSCAIVCAEHRTIADDIIAGLSGKQRSEMGMFGLSKRVRAKVKEFEEGPKPPKGPRASNTVREQVEAMREEFENRLAALEPKSTSDLVGLLVRRDPAELLEVARLHDPLWFERFMLAARNAAEWQASEI